MVDDPDIWRAANLLVKRHGDVDHARPTAHPGGGSSQTILPIEGAPSPAFPTGLFFERCGVWSSEETGRRFPNHPPPSYWLTADHRRCGPRRRDRICVPMDKLP
jgi:hypothetical protein